VEAPVAAPLTAEPRATPEEEDAQGGH
jgi:hypothetical protein